MSDTAEKTALRVARERAGYSRERVAAMLDPPVSSKTVERWEKTPRLVTRWRLRQFAALYEVKITSLNGTRAA